MAWALPAPSSTAKVMANLFMGRPDGAAEYRALTSNTAAGGISYQETSKGSRRCGESRNLASSC
jgi:hypothetical protein